jgi:hypothetical protein
MLFFICCLVLMLVSVLITLYKSVKRSIST